MQILIIGYVWPEPNSSAAGSRMMQLIQAMVSRSWQVTFASPAAQTEHMQDLEVLGVVSCHIELNNQSFDSFVEQLQPEVVIFDRFMMEEQFGWRVEKHCPQALRVLNTEDLHSLRLARQTAVKQGKELNTEDMYSELAVREVAAILRSDLALMVSEFEMDLLQQEFHIPDYLLCYLPFMLEQVTPEQQSCFPDFEQREHFITIGNFRHQPNWDAVLQLKQHIWPAIRKRLPKAELHVYGAYPPPKATQLHNPKQGFMLKGWAEDASLVMQNARVCLAPLRFGAGIKGKLTEAMQNGTPSVTTKVGAEAMAGPLPWSGAICSLNTDEPEFVDAAIELYSNEAHWRKAQDNGFEILQIRYDKVHWQGVLISRLTQQRQDRERLRKQNFYGQMMRHHSMKSTQYMSQWIEAKNNK